MVQRRAQAWLSRYPKPRGLVSTSRKWHLPVSTAQETKGLQYAEQVRMRIDAKIEGKDVVVAPCPNSCHRQYNRHRMHFIFGNVTDLDLASNNSLSVALDCRTLIVVCHRPITFAMADSWVDASPAWM
jgi:hypothetical protein